MNKLFGLILCVVCGCGGAEDNSEYLNVQTVRCKNSKATIAIEPNVKSVETYPKVITVFYYNDGCSIILDKTCLPNYVTAICGDNTEITFTVN